MSDEYSEAIPVYRGRLIIGWIDRNAIRYYNTHASLGENIYRVGEAVHAGEKIWVFDRSCFQWAEFSDLPDVLSRE